MDYKEELLFYIESISTNSVRSIVKEILDKVPETFWTKPSSKNHHHPDERIEGGNVLHSLRVIKIVQLICDMTDMPIIERDEEIGAAAVHDVMKYGIDGNSNYILSNHAKIMANWILDNFGGNVHARNISNIVATHMGKWETPPNSVTISQNDILKIADCLSVRDQIDIK